MKICISDLEFKTIIGILDFERKKKQKVSITLSFDYIYNKDNFIDYAKVVKLIKKSIKKGKFFLIEDAILTLEDKITKKYDVKNIKISISKPNILKNCIVSISN